MGTVHSMQENFKGCKAIGGTGTLGRNEQSITAKKNCHSLPLPKQPPHPSKPPTNPTKPSPNHNTPSDLPISHHTPSQENFQGNYACLFMCLFVSGSSSAHRHDEPHILYQNEHLSPTMMHM